MGDLEDIDGSLLGTWRKGSPFVPNSKFLARVLLFQKSLAFMGKMEDVDGSSLELGWLGHLLCSRSSLYMKISFNAKFQSFRLIMTFSIISDLHGGLERCSWFLTGDSKDIHGS